MVNSILSSNIRLQLADNLSFDIAFLALLPKRNEATRLRVKYYHKSGHQMGLNDTINHLNGKYLLVHTHEQVKRIMRGVFIGRNDFDRNQLMASLPRMRPQQSFRPFINCTVYIGGSNLTKDGAKFERSATCVYSCVQAHVQPFRDGVLLVHWRISWCIHTDDYAERMISCTKCSNDNGTNFVSSLKGLKELF